MRGRITSLGHSTRGTKFFIELAIQPRSFILHFHSSHPHGMFKEFKDALGFFGDTDNFHKDLVMDLFNDVSEAIKTKRPLEEKSVVF